MKIKLYTTYYRDKDEQRHLEYLKVLQRNLDNKLIDKIFILAEDISNFPFDNNKFELILTEGRPKFNEFIDCINKNTGTDDYHLFANTDIYFDDTLKYLEDIDFKDTVLSLNRWDVLEDDSLRFFNRYYTTDTFVFKGKVKEMDAPYYLGQLGCDNRFNYELTRNGYKTLNPSYTIKTYHLHVSMVRSYLAQPSKYQTVPPPYVYSLPEFLSIKHLFNSFKNNGIKQTLYLIRMYRSVRQVYFKNLFKKNLENGGQIQKKYTKFGAFIRWILNYSVVNIN